MMLLPDRFHQGGMSDFEGRSMLGRRCELRRRDRRWLMRFEVCTLEGWSTVAHD
jgi:hypothetical protein